MYVSMYTANVINAFLVYFALPPVYASVHKLITPSNSPPLLFVSLNSGVTKSRFKRVWDEEDFRGGKMLILGGGELFFKGDKINS